MPQAAMPCIQFARVCCFSVALTYVVSMPQAAMPCIQFDVYLENCLNGEDVSMPQAAMPCIQFSSGGTKDISTLCGFNAASGNALYTIGGTGEGCKSKVPGGFNAASGNALYTISCSVKGWHLSFVWFQCRKRQCPVYNDWNE